MTDLRKAAEMALEALLNYPLTEGRAIQALRQALAQPDETKTLKRCLFQMQEAAKALAQPEQSVEPPAYVEPVTYDYHNGWEEGFKAGVEASQPKQEPYCWVQSKLNQGMFYREKPRRIHTIPLYTAPPKQWVGLTDEERMHFNNRLSGSGVAEDIEAVLRNRNA